MAASAQANAVAIELEKVRTIVPELHEMETNFVTTIPDRTEDLEVSGRAFRLPLEMRIGGYAGQYSADGGNLGRGSGPDFQFATSTPVALRYAVEITDAAIAYTNGKAKAVENLVTRAVAGGMKQFKAFEDALCQTAGDNLIGTISAVNGNVFTMSAGFQHRLMYVGQKITTEQTDTTWQAVNGTCTVTNIDPIAGKVTVDAVPAGTDPGDLVGIENPATPAVSGNATALLGLAYHMSNATTGTWMGLDRSLFNQIVAPGIDASTGTLSRSMLRQAISAIRFALGVDAAKDLLVFGNITQFDAYESLGIEISSIIKESPQGSTSGYDALFNQDQLKVAGFPTLGSIHADVSRLYFLNKSTWGRATAVPPQFKSVDGQTRFAPMDTSGGGLVASILWYWIHHWQLWTDNPRKNSYIYNLAVPSGYLN